MDIEKHILKKIQKLLRLAKNKGATEGEAKNAMAMAQALMTKYKINMAVADEGHEEGISHDSCFLGRGPLNPADVYIMKLIQRFYHVRILRRCSRQQELIFIGSEQDIAIAKYVHGFLRSTFFRCWNEFKTTVPSPSRPAYYFGLYTGLSERMEAAEKAAKAEANTDERNRYEIVLVNTNAAINAYIAQKFGTPRDTRVRSRRVDAASFIAGKVKGSTLHINKAISI